MRTIRHQLREPGIDLPDNLKRGSSEPLIVQLLVIVTGPRLVVLLVEIRQGVVHPAQHRPVTQRAGELI
jgi:hypothetical protein